MDTHEGTMVPRSVLQDTLVQLQHCALRNTSMANRIPSFTLLTLILTPRPSDQSTPHAHNHLLQPPSPNPQPHQQRKTSDFRNSWT